MGSRFVSAGTSDAGNVRGNNEDRVYIDSDRGIYLVVDGMGGQAAGEEAAEIAVNTVKSRLERPTEGAEQRVREAIALANNAIFEAAANRAEWRGMACVLTLALFENGHAVVGHVGDSRAYQIRNGKIEKITKDHSPVGEREDSGELSEEAAMRHPRRNEVFRDVGSTPRTPDDADFIDIKRIPVPDDSALLICSDGLSDVVPSRRILQVVEENASDCDAAVRTLVRAAVADGKDNVSVVLVEGRDFPSSIRERYRTRVPEAEPARSNGGLGFFFLGMALALAGCAASYFFMRPPTTLPEAAHGPATIHAGTGFAPLAEAMEKAAAGDTVELSPGTYPAQLALKAGVTVRSAPPRAAVLSGGVLADAVDGAALRDVAVGAPGIEVNSSNVLVDGVESAGPVRFTGISTGSLRGSKIAASVKIRDTASPELSVNFIQGDVEFTSKGALKLDGNAIQGALFLSGLPSPAISADLVKRNIFAGKKPIQTIKPAGERR